MPDNHSTKKCCVCKRFEPLSEFYKHAGRKDGLQTSCKTCMREYSKTDIGKLSHYSAGVKYRKTGAGKRYQVEYQKTDAGRLANTRHQSKYRNSDAGKLVIAKRTSKYRANNPIKKRSQHAVSNAIRSGRLIKPDNCEQCSVTGPLHGHHDDYTMPLVVRWLCELCHNAWHAENGPGLNG